jgi:hypothetical protein
MKNLIKVIAMTAVAVPLALAVAGSVSTPHPLSTAGQSAAPYTAEQQIAVRRAYQAQAHPQWRQLSTSARVDRLMMFGRRMMRILPADLTAIGRAS